MAGRRNDKTKVIIHKRKCKLTLILTPTFFGRDRPSSRLGSWRWSWRCRRRSAGGRGPRRRPSHPRGRHLPDRPRCRCNLPSCSRHRRQHCRRCRLAGKRACRGGGRRTRGGGEMQGVQSDLIVDTTYVYLLPYPLVSVTADQLLERVYV